MLINQKPRQKVKPNFVYNIGKDNKGQKLQASAKDIIEGNVKATTNQQKAKVRKIRNKIEL